MSSDQAVIEEVILDRLLSRITTSQSWSGCFLWSGRTSQKGYGRISLKNKEVAVHRLAYKLAYGHLDEALTIDHLCTVKRCVNPLHLEQVTSVENTRRATMHGLNKKPRKTHCKHGHEFSTENTYIWKGSKRSCRRCKAIRSNGYYHSKDQ